MSFSEEQAALYQRVHRGEVRVVDVDPDGTLPEDWMAVVIHHPTGVVYVNQSAGVACEQRMAEGYLVMLGGAGYDVDEPWIDGGDLIAIFHNGDRCMYPWAGGDVPEERIRDLSKAVRQISYWSQGSDNPLGVHGRLELDLSRRDALAEGWIPVLTLDGPGILIHQNCD